MAKHPANPYTRNPITSKNPYTKGQADQETARKFGFEAKSDNRSETELRGAKPKKY